MNLLLFVAGGVGVWLCGSRLAAAADEISDRLRIGRALMGFVFLATITSLPEIVTTVVAAGGGEAELALGNLLGGVGLQFGILAVADAFAGHAAISWYPRKTTIIMEGVLLALLLAFLLATLMLGEITFLGWIGAGSTLLAAVYVLTMFILRRHEESGSWVPVEIPEAGLAETEGPLVSHFPEFGNNALYMLFAGLSLGLAIAATITVFMAERIAGQTGMGTGFVGVTLLAMVTSLPELSTTVAAVRIGAYTMAISNIFGSNLLMLALIWPADILYRGGPILQKFDPVLDLSLISGLIITLIYVSGLVLRSRRTVLGFGLDSLAVLGVLAITLVFYWLRAG
jgi:cation:H+ antiporter